jgi:hypothetical protein
MSEIQTQNQFNEFCFEIIPQQLFHVTTTDLDDNIGCRLDELTLVNLLHNNPTALKFKSLEWFVKTYITNQEN